jgi:hypothetical protein
MAGDCGVSRRYLVEGIVFAVGGLVAWWHPPPPKVVGLVGLMYKMLMEASHGRSA